MLLRYTTLIFLKWYFFFCPHELIKIIWLFGLTLKYAQWPCFNAQYQESRTLIGKREAGVGMETTGKKKEKRIGKIWAEARKDGRRKSNQEEEDIGMTPIASKAPSK